jgi:hypothetical protein
VSEENLTGCCPYCEWTFTITRRHRAERVLPYCSHGCRLAGIDEPSSYVFEVDEERMSAAKAEQPGWVGTAGLEPIRAFMRTWISATPLLRDVVAVRLVHPDADNLAIARQLKCSADAVCRIERKAASLLGIMGLRQNRPRAILRQEHESKHVGQRDVVAARSGQGRGGRPVRRGGGGTAEERAGR